MSTNPVTSEGTGTSDKRARLQFYNEKLDSLDRARSKELSELHELIDQTSDATERSKLFRKCFRVREFYHQQIQFTAFARFQIITGINAFTGGVNVPPPKRNSFDDPNTDNSTPVVNGNNGEAINADGKGIDG